MDVAGGFVFLMAVGVAFVAVAVGGYAYARRPGVSPLVLFPPTQRGLVIQAVRMPENGHAGVIWFFADSETARQMRGYGRVGAGRVDEQTGIMLYTLAVSQFVSFESVYAEMSDLALGMCPHQTIPTLPQRMVN